MHFISAQHFNSRIWIPFIYDESNKALWGGWLIVKDNKTLFLQVIAVIPNTLMR